MICNGLHFALLLNEKEETVNSKVSKDCFLKWFKDINQLSQLQTNLKKLLQASIESPIAYLHAKESDIISGSFKYL